MNKITDRDEQVSKLLLMLCKELDISDAKYREAEHRYNAVGKWLKRPESTVRAYAPDIYVQGSFRLGTVIKPISDEGEYDIDSVCKLELTTEHCSQKDLKHLVGDEIKKYATAQAMKNPADEGKRCWTLNYADESKFHMDILPSIPSAEFFKLLLEKRAAESEWTDDAIAITDNTHEQYEEKGADWLVSNPKGYSDWFQSRMVVVARTNYSTSESLMEKYASIEEVPAFEFKTPLQRAIQVLKYHRDLKFGDDENKPISIIITTLAAHAYNNESDVKDALVGIVENMLSHIRDKEGICWVANPVNPLENFADKWPEHPKRKEIFYQWHAELKADLRALIASEGGMHNFGAGMSKLAGEGISETVMKKYAQNIKTARDNGMLKAAKGSAMLGAIGTTVKSHKFYGS